MATIITPGQNNRRPIFPQTPQGETAAINAFIRGTSNTSITYDPGSAIRFA